MRSIRRGSIRTPMAALPMNRDSMGMDKVAAVRRGEGEDAGSFRIEVAEMLGEVTIMEAMAEKEDRVRAEAAG